MEIEQWHGGKVLLVWLIGVAVTLLAYRIALNAITDSIVLDILLMLALIAPFVVCVVMTWYWFAMRERRR